MKFVLKNLGRENIYHIARKIGYFFKSKNKESSEFIFTRPVKGFPRFHLFLKVEDNNLVFNLHLDQKRPIYKNSIAHAGEYKGKILEKEAERIKQILRE